MLDISIRGSGGEAGVGTEEGAECWGLAGKVCARGVAG